MTQRRGRDGRDRPQKTQVTVPDDVSEFYANSLNVSINPWDVTLFFGSIVLPETIGTGSQLAHVRVDAVIRMSPQHAKAMVKVIQGSVEQYEQQYGEIIIPESTN